MRASDDLRSSGSMAWYTASTPKTLTSQTARTSSRETTPSCDSARGFSMSCTSVWVLEMAA